MNIAPAPNQTNQKSHRACASLCVSACSENSAVMISTIGFENERRLEQSGVTSSHWWSEKDGESCETYYHRNKQYSINAVTTSTGAVAERYAYSAYGEPTFLNSSGSAISQSTINNRQSFTGREWDSTVGLHHFRARWMSPKTGRFLRRDPIGFEADDESLYRFILGRALSLRDPLGLGATGFSDPAGRKCGSNDTCTIAICAECPGKSVVEQVATNLANGQPAMQGIESGHYDNYRNLWKQGKLSCIPWNVCPETLVRILSPMVGNMPEYHYLPWDPESPIRPMSEEGCENCTTMARKQLCAGGIEFPILVEPFQICKHPKCIRKILPKPEGRK
jgi:RHS repeat-associated protein